ncbi:MAG: GNAT family N-acetyltransferase [Myxococcales bacterium]|jgi:ribosomal-protein-alanine N-acetyltransferase
MADVVLMHPTLEHEPEFLAAVARSWRLHRPWVSPPSTPAAFREYLAKAGAERTIAHLVRHRDGGLVGVINVSEIVRGVFQSAYLGYYAFEPFAGRGLMRQAMALAISEAFRRHRLHRLEANIQPDNVASRALVQRLGFELEGFSPRYLKIGGRWRDHERWAVRAETWRPRATGC